MLPALPLVHVRRCDSLRGGALLESFQGANQSVSDCARLFLAEANRTLGQSLMRRLRRHDAPAVRERFTNFSSPLPSLVRQVNRNVAGFKHTPSLASVDVVKFGSRLARTTQAENSQLRNAFASELDGFVQEFSLPWMKRREPSHDGLCIPIRRKPKLAPHRLAIRYMFECELWMSQRADRRVLVALVAYSRTELFIPHDERVAVTNHGSIESLRR